MERLEWILSTLEQMLNTKQKRHIAGGVFGKRCAIVRRIGSYGSDVEG